MGKTPTNAGAKKMTDTAMARGFVSEIGKYAHHRNGNLVDRVYDACADFARKRRTNDLFTRRRIRAFWHREAAVISYSEMCRLAEVAASEKEQFETLQEARETHAKFIAHTARMEALLVSQDEAFHCDQIEALRRGAGGMGVPGTRGDE